MTPEGSSAAHGPRDTQIALMLVASLLGVVLPAAALGLGRASEWLRGGLFNVCFCVCCFVFARLFSGRPTRPGVTARLATVVLAVVLTVATGMVFVHGWFFDVAIERRLTLLDLSVSGLRTFARSALPARGWLLLIATFVGGWLATRLLWRRVGALARWRGALWLVPIALVVVVLLPGLPRSPLFDQAQEAWLLASNRSIEPASGPEPEQLTAWLDKSARTHVEGVPRHAKVIVLVMETMTAAALASQTAALPADTFLRRETDRMLTFDRYYPNNQDSRTGMLDMLFSRVVPYEAYSDAGYAGYRQLAEVPSLVERMRALGYASAFAVSQVALEEVVGELPWDATLHLSPAAISAAKSAGKLCFSPDVWEQSCEDAVLLPDVVDFVASRPRAFVYQEFIWGHAAEYNEASGLSNAAYYSQYVDALLAALEQRGLRDDTLVVLTSDHGFRDKGQQHDPEVYRVPLLFHAAGMTAGRDARLTSHADLGMLMFEQLVAGAPRADDNPFVMIVGPTGQGHTFVVGRDGGHVLIWHRLFGERVLARAGALSLTPEVLLGTRERYRARFDAQLRRVIAH